jgi:hypothetical protein
LLNFELFLFVKKIGYCVKKSALLRGEFFLHIVIMAIKNRELHADFKMAKFLLKVKLKKSNTMQPEVYPKFAEGLTLYLTDATQFRYRLALHTNL